ncbi:MAG: FkbM family methyltransferase [Candidatus Thorarchaeota archaeon]|nr:FkbM family methyltransferase [Candidatus Thorarchaeota archaeon]
MFLRGGRLSGIISFILTVRQKDNNKFNSSIRNSPQYCLKAKMGLHWMERLRKAVLRRLLPTSRMIKIEVQGHVMVIDKTHLPSLYYNGVHEPETTEYLRANVKPGCVAVDIGANVGYFTLVFANLVGTSGRVFAFEPDERIFHILTENIRLNGYQNINLDNRAVSDNNGRQRFYLNSHLSRSGLTPSGSTKRITEVETVKLDTLNFERVDWVKIDVEGAEVSVLKGMKRTISDNPNIQLIVEFVPEHIVDSGHTVDEFFDLLDGFDFCGLDNNLVCFRNRI